MRILEELMRVMHMDPLTRDVGFDMLCDTIVARAAQLQKLETDSLVDRKTHIYNLQRKVQVLFLLSFLKITTHPAIFLMIRMHDAIGVSLRLGFHLVIPARFPFSFTT